MVDSGELFHSHPDEPRACRKRGIDVHTLLLRDFKVDLLYPNGFHGSEWLVPHCSSWRRWNDANLGFTQH
jgi:hypothetical protein